jgi:hypothetical protein
MKQAWSNLVRRVPLPAIASVLNYLVDRPIRRNLDDLSVTDVSEAEFDAILEFLLEQGFVFRRGAGEFVLEPDLVEATRCLARLSVVILQPYSIDEPLSASGRRMLRNVHPKTPSGPSTEALAEAADSECWITRELGLPDAPERVFRVYSPAWVALALRDDHERARDLADQAAVHWGATRREDMRLLFELASEAIARRIESHSMVNGPEAEAIENEINRLIGDPDALSLRMFSLP